MPAMHEKKRPVLKQNWDSDSDSDSPSSSSSSSSSTSNTATPKNTAHDTNSAPPSPFLLLPRELRLQIYTLALLPLHTAHHTLALPPSARRAPSAVTLIHKYPSNGALLATCRQVHWEISALFDVLGLDLGRGSVRVIGDGGSLHAGAFRGLLGCAGRGLKECVARTKGVVPGEVVGCFDFETGFGVRSVGEGKRVVRSHEELHGLLDGVGIQYGSGHQDGGREKGAKKVIELAIQEWKGDETLKWECLAFSVPRFDRWAARKSSEGGVKLEIVVRLAVPSEAALEQWRNGWVMLKRYRGAIYPFWPERRAGPPLGDVPKGSKGGKGKSYRITRSEGEIIGVEEWRVRWVGEGISRPRSGLG